MDPVAPGAVRELIARHGFRIKKSLGQNFLIDGNIIKKIIAAVAPSPADTVVEIGPGIGALTGALAAQAGQVLAVEIDRRLIPVLEETMAGINNVCIVQADALKTDFDSLVQSRAGTPVPTYKVAANLPYYITTPLLMHLLEKQTCVGSIVVMVQEEVARRLTAQPATPEYGALTVAVNFYARPEMLFRVPRTVFMPRPEVDSAVVKIEVNRLPAAPVQDKEVFFALVRAAFQQRRKTLLNAVSAVDKRLSKEMWTDVFRQADIAPGRRGETLDLVEFARLADAYVNRREKSKIN
ncbi:MAG: 16S rRNA (adenine(1518)-N(6)/adenine(1519)-N(6))-dimethyltransferase RsmA [Firmicutes bacterium]|nr:16S rRNA (adenine(1518)-N(6)/adenine(1519)-N(6))-dimethyltransferase RsmA [Bacillota bacterium]